MLRDLSNTYLYLPHPLLHDTDVGRIYCMLYGRKPSVPAVSRIPDYWNHQRQNRHICVLGREMPLVKEGMYLYTAA